MALKKHSLIKLSFLLFTLISLSLSMEQITSSRTTERIVLNAKAKGQKKSNPKLDEKGILSFTKEKQLRLGKLDKYGRATGAHIQLSESDTPTKKREPRLSYNPVGWHNYKFYFEDGKKKAWLMNRGHLIGYLFSGLNNEPRNLVPITAFLNSGQYRGTNDQNDASMLFYEKRLDSWLSTHPNYWLDYQVTPIYQVKELIPRQIILQYVGIDTKGKLLPIDIGGKATKDEWGISRVVLDNVSPNAELDYLTGTAVNTVQSAKKQKAVRLAEEARLAKEKVAEEARLAQEKATEEERLVAERAAQEAEAQRIAAEQAAQAQSQVQANTEQSRIVYVARQGSADVYWYSTDNMPSNTRFDRVISMTEAEAIALGKRHTTKE